MLTTTNPKPKRHGIIGKIIDNEELHMSKINLKGITSETTAGILILLLALVNAILQIFGINIIPIKDEDITAIVSTVFLILTTLYNTWKNRNITSASQITQNITDAIKNGVILEEDVKTLIDKIKESKTGDTE